MADISSAHQLGTGARTVRSVLGWRKGTSYPFQPLPLYHAGMYCFDCWTIENFSLVSWKRSDSQSEFQISGPSDLEVVRPTDQLLDKLQLDLTIYSHIFITPRNFQSLLGLLNFLAPLVVLGCLHMSPNQFWLLKHWSLSYPSIYEMRSKSGQIQLGYFMQCC